uniref:Pectinesterase inhibitor domain-containing protein n=2 Tax=Triticum urartu TaxID=4572 RepID=A0A8R7PMQ2_TRIUA
MSYGLPATHADINFIARTCKKTNNFALCMAVLRGNPKSAQASTEHDLANIALQIATDTIRKNTAAICDLDYKHQGTPEAPVWHVCVKAHVLVAANLIDGAGPSFHVGDYADVLKIVSEAKGAGDTCENAFKAVHKASPMAYMDRQTTEHCGLAGDLICLLLTK